MNLGVSGFGFRGATQLFVEADHWVEWVLGHQHLPKFSHETHYGLGHVVQYEWNVGDEHINAPVEKWTFTPRVLPDGSGFIGFEPVQSPSNCVVLDAYGQQRLRLTVPWGMTGATAPASGESPTAFLNVSEPYENPQTGKRGVFGVTAWVELAGLFYFELDYHSGEFLWCRQIRD